ncbi:two-component sensor histidine kinase [Enterococcus sp. BWT-B8]|uniref:sensor histidine kinase n=1 Tax=Enterococcus sp. BWT-B8 TaxID=2885157 RepID=UPI001E5E282A|nr:ATP-binding protein [Enterococcus sp. BWT-B8]MCB5950581.1 two-component sensor histidine kinase [Enterococcus sp. BWT-B8]
MNKRQRLEYFLAVSLMLILFFVSIFTINSFFKRELMSQQVSYLQKKTTFLSKQLTDNVFLQESLTAQESNLLKEYTESNEERISLLNSEGELFYDTTDKNLDETRAQRPEIKAVIAGADFGSSHRISTTLNVDLLYLALPIKSDGKLIGIIRVSEEASKFSGSIRTFRNFLISIFSLLFLILTIFILLMIRQKNKPLLTVLPFLKRMIKDPEKNRSIIQESSEWNELYETANELSHQMSETYRAYTSTEEQLHSLLNGLMIGVFIIDKNGNLELINAVMRDFLMFTGKPAEKESYLKTINDPTMIHLINQAITEEKNVQQEISLAGSNEERIIDLSLHYFDNDFNNHQIFGVAYDLSQVRRLEKIQKDFVGNVSHELKTPVTSLIGFTETLLDGAKEDPETLNQFLEIIQKDAYRLERLIQEIILLSRDSKNSYEKQAIHLYPFTNEIIQSYQKSIAEKKIQIEIVGDQTLSFTTVYELFQPIIKNLIENAIQYSTIEGHITVTFDTIDQHLNFSVQDTGLGIPLEDQKRIFERFYRVDKARTRNSGGTGLGLAIVQNYSELLGGTVTVESYPGIGSLFTLSLPL